jgi:uncharacterized iron-regulated protein
MSASIRRAAVSVVAIAVIGCAGRPRGAAEPATAGIEAAALPYQIVDARTGRSVDESAFWARLAATRAICVGEEHPNPHHHWMQLHIVRELIKRLPKGTRLALAMEMFQRPFQGVLDDYAARRIDAATLRSRSGYRERWGYEYTFYGPTIDAAVDAGAQLLAANAARELTKKVVRQGLESLTAEERAQVPELKLDDPAHRSWFDALMESMGGTAAHSRSRSTDQKGGDQKGGGQKGGDQKGGGQKGGDQKGGDQSGKAESVPASDAPPQHGRDPAPAMPSADRVYAVQVIWDETMAETGARWLASHPDGHLILLAGDGHCHDSAIIGRMKRRGVSDAVSVRGVIDDGEGKLAETLARPINDYVFVLRMPAQVERKAEAQPRR